LNPWPLSLQTLPSEQNLLKIKLSKKLIFQLSANFENVFQTCLKEKVDEKINLYVKHIPICGGRLTKKYTISVAKKELELASQSTLPDIPEIHSKIKQEIFPSFKIQKMH
jgi:hypothetical protein